MIEIIIIEVTMIDNNNKLLTICSCKNFVLYFIYYYITYILYINIKIYSVFVLQRIHFDFIFNKRKNK